MCPDTDCGDDPAMAFLKLWIKIEISMQKSVVGGG